MIDLSNLQPTIGSTKKSVRLGRGLGSGCGKTSGRGHKGAGARKSSGIARGFEGGQMPLQKRVPKFGFNSKFDQTTQIVNLSDLEKRMENEVTNETLFKARLIKKIDHPVKLLANGSVTKVFQVLVDQCSKVAAKSIEAAGGTVQVTKKSK